jgi:hypothetical protein
VAAVAPHRSSLTAARAPERCASRTNTRELISLERETSSSRIDLSLVLLREPPKESQQTNSTKGRLKKEQCSITRKVSTNMSLSWRLWRRELPWQSKTTRPRGPNPETKSQVASLFSLTRLTTALSTSSSMMLPIATPLAKSMW